MFTKENRTRKRLIKTGRTGRGNSEAGKDAYNCIVFRVLTSTSVSTEERRGQSGQQRWRQTQSLPNGESLWRLGQRKYRQQGAKFKSLLSSFLKLFLFRMIYA